MLGFYHGLLLLAGVGAVTVIRMKSNAAGRILRASLLFAGTAHLLLQSYLLNFQYEADPSNPYVYAHTSSDVLRITEKVAALAAAHPDGRDMYIEVVCPGDDYWPLPWYFRAYGNVGWWNEVDFAIPPAPLIIVAPEVERALLKKLYELPPPGRKHLYVPLCEEYTELRPGIELRGYVRKDLWDRSLRGASESTPQ